MRSGWFAILALVCGLVVRENFTLVASSLVPFSSNPSHQDEPPSQNPEMPVPLEGEEVEWLTSDGADETFCLFTFHEGLSLFLVSALRESNLPSFSSSQELLNTLQRLQI